MGYQLETHWLAFLATLPCLASFVSLTLTSDLTLEVIAPGPVFMTSLLLDWPVGWAEFYINPWTLDR